MRVEVCCITRSLPRASLTDIEFVINPYNSCVANKMIDGKQMTICWHVNNLEANHVRPKAEDQIVKYFCQEYQSIFEDGFGVMPVSRGKVCKYLGMDLDYSVRDQVKISMFDYINEILAAFDTVEPKGAGTKRSAAPENIFMVNEDCKKNLSDKTVQLFHNLAAKTLYSTKRARPDTCTSISFLTT